MLDYDNYMKQVVDKVRKLSTAQRDELHVTAGEVTNLDGAKRRKKPWPSRSTETSKVRYCFALFALKTKVAGSRTKDINKFLVQVYVNKIILGHCSNILREYGILSDRSWYLITEYPEYGNLCEFLKNEKNASLLSWEWKTRQACNIAQALSFCHSRNILHQDVRSPNVVINQFMTAKLTNFGFQTIIHDNKCVYEEGNQKIRWLAPEKLKDNRVPYSRETDVYSFGMLLWEISAHKIPYEDILDPNKVKKRVEEEKRPEIDPDTPSNFVRIMTSCWKQNPNERPKMETVWERLGS